MFSKENDNEKLAFEMPFILLLDMEKQRLQTEMSQQHDGVMRRIAKRLSKLPTTPVSSQQKRMHLEEEIGKNL